jgi:hypothetical protein
MLRPLKKKKETKEKRDVAVVQVDGKRNVVVNSRHVRPQVSVG